MGLPQEFFAFFLKQVRSSIFALFIFLMLAISHFVPTIPRYDFLLISCLALQTYMVKSGMESRKELGIVCGFHVVGLMLELYKVRHGSWTYPEFAFSKVGGVPLYSGFMYASVASYILQATRVFNLQFHKMPKTYWAGFCIFLVYLQFFAGAVIGDQRLIVSLVLTGLFWPAKVNFDCRLRTFTMPLTFAFFLIGSCIYAGENIATFLGAWAYPHQLDGWELVHPTKIVSWTLMATVGFVMLWSTKTLESRAHRLSESKLFA